MKKRLMCFFLAAVLAAGASMTAYAKDYQGKDGWKVVFDGEKMNSTFQSQDLADEAGNIQPGDSIELKIEIQNGWEGETDWYMTNSVLQTLEEGSTANGGAYTYRLVYAGKGQTETVLFDSDGIGGEQESGAGQGLHQATDSMEDYFYLTRLSNGESGTVRLKVGIDGETQGNAYQETLAKLQMNFAAEKVAAGGTETRNRTVYSTVKTGDTAKVLLFSVLALISGLALLAYVVFIMKKNQRKAAKRRRRAKGE